MIYIYNIYIYNNYVFKLCFCDSHIKLPHCKAVTECLHLIVNSNLFTVILK